LNELIASEPEALTADLFVCRSSEAKEAKPDADGKLVLEDENLSFAWLSRRLKNTAVNKIIAPTSTWMATRMERACASATRA